MGIVAVGSHTASAVVVAVRLPLFSGGRRCGRVQGSKAKDCKKILKWLKDQPEAGALPAYFIPAFRGGRVQVCGQPRAGWPSLPQALVKKFSRSQPFVCDEPEPFSKPVDWKAWGLHDYPMIVKTPMDISKVEVRCLLTAVWVQRTGVLARPQFSASLHRLSLRGDRGHRSGWMTASTTPPAAL